MKPKKIIRTRGLFVGACAVMVLVPMSLAHPFGDPRHTGGPPDLLLAGAQIPEPLRELVAQKCGNCHSQAVKWPMYSRVAPMSWLIDHDVSKARSHMNLSRWDDYSRQDKLDLLSRLAAEIRSGEMPPARYTAIHRDSTLKQSEKDALYEWTRTERRRLRKESQETEAAK